MISSASPIRQLIADVIEAKANHDRLFYLSDWGLATEQEAIDACDVIDQAFVALCRARPLNSDEAAIRAEFISNHAVERLEGDRSLTEKVIRALVEPITAAEPVRMTGSDRRSL